MSVTAIFALITAIAQAIPVFAKWLEQFNVWYINQQIDKMAAENVAAIKKAIQEKDQRDLEKALGNPNAGEPSNLPGVTQRDTIVGLSK